VLVTQSFGPACNAGFTPAPGPTSALTFGGAGGGGSFWTFAEPAFTGPWRVLGASDWITPTSPPIGVVRNGDGAATFAVAPNPSTEPRIGTITFCSGSAQIHQAGRSQREGSFVAGDFDDDGRADPAVFRPSNGTWYVLPSAQNYNYAAALSYQWGHPAHFGFPGDTAVPGDFDGDKKAELAAYDPSAGYWRIRHSSNGYSLATQGLFRWPQAFHAPENRPLLADFSGDGKSDFVIYRPSVGRWHILFASRSVPGGDLALQDIQWGLAGDIPVPTDYDGDGRADLAVWRPQSGEWYLRFSATNYTTVAVHQWGLPGDEPQVSDFDGDGRADLAVYRPLNGMWYIKHSSTDYNEATHSEYQWGLPGDKPMASDYDGDGRTDLAVWRPSTAVWFIRDSSGNFGPHAWRAYQWGHSTDVPLGQR
jgi:hypothetical protein